jgi:hypothetical protein
LLRANLGELTEAVDERFAIVYLAQERFGLFEKSFCAGSQMDLHCLPSGNPECAGACHGLHAWRVEQGSRTR